MTELEQLLLCRSEIEAKLGYHFTDPSLLALAFAHRSYANECKVFNEHNERLEFLGDSVLGLIVTDYLYRELPEIAEGELSVYRSRLVEAGACVLYVQKLQLGSYLLLGRGERMNDGRGRDSLYADLFEAVIGAIFLDGGFEAARYFFFLHFTEEVNRILTGPISNAKALLQDICQKKFQQAPVYRVLEESGPDHSKLFKVAVLVQDCELGRGEGNSKKEAQQEAAAKALQHVSLS